MVDGVTVDELNSNERAFLNALISTVRMCYLANIRKPDTAFSGMQIFFEKERPRVRALVDYFPA